MEAQVPSGPSRTSRPSGTTIFVIFIALLVVGGFAAALWWIISNALKTKTDSGPAPPSKDETLKPLTSASADAVKTGDPAVQVSGYSYNRREYADGACTFIPSMTKFVTIKLTLGIDTTDTALKNVDKIRATWKAGDVVIADTTLDFSSTNIPGASLTMNIAGKPDTTVNIACNSDGTTRTDNVILIEYSTIFTEMYTKWGTVEIKELPTSLLTSFESIPVGKGTLLPVELVAATIATQELASSQFIPYTLTRKSDGRRVEGPPLYLSKGTEPNTFMVGGSPGEPVGPGGRIILKTFKIDGVPEYKDYVAFKMIGNEIVLAPSSPDYQKQQDALKQVEGKFVCFGTEQRFRADYDDTCFYKIEAQTAKTVEGWNSDVYYKYTIYDSASENPHIDYTTEGCLGLAYQKGGDAFTLRKSNHGAGGHYRNSCIITGNLPAGYTQVGDMLNKSEHESGCLDQSRTWPNCRLGAAPVPVPATTL